MLCLRPKLIPILFLGLLIHSCLSANPADFDLGFNNSGIAVFENDTLYLYDNISLALQKDGKIVISGSSGNRMGVLRYTPQGQFDTTFNGNGGTISYYGGTPAGLAIQSDGKILVGGQVTNYEQSGFGAYRFNSDGSTDNNFGHLGLALHPIGSCYISSMALRADGSFVLAGQTDYSHYSYVSLFVSQFLPNGQLDLSFNESGISYSKIVYELNVQKMRIRPDGHILVAANPDMRVIGFLPDGRLDLDYFGYFNSQRTVTGGVLENAADGKMWLGASINDYTSKDFVLVRLNADGTPDESFNTDGLTSVDFDGADVEVTCMAFQHNGKILLGGTSGGRLAVARLNPDGSLDTSFNGTGKFIFEDDFGACAINLQKDGKILIAGRSYLLRLLGDPTSGEIVIEHPAGTILESAVSTISFAPTLPDGISSQTLTIKNLGGDDLSLQNFSFTGADATEFSVSAPAPTQVSSGQEITFTLQFASSTAGEKNAMVQILSDAGNTPAFAIQLTALCLAPELDHDHDGVTNEAEIRMASLGFDPLVDSSATRDLLHQNAAGAGLFGDTDLETLALNSLLLKKDTETGRFKLRLNLETTQDLKTWQPLTGYLPTFDPETGKIELEIQAEASGPQFFKVLGTKP